MSERERGADDEMHISKQGRLMKRGPAVILGCSCKGLFASIIRAKKLDPLSS